VEVLIYILNKTYP